jgi:long-chain fatty acid transport protein
MHKPLRTIVNTAILSVLAASTAHAGSFSLYTESSAAAIGNYAAGVAAEAADASTGWYNPAGLALLHNQQVVFGGVGVFPSSKLTGSSTFHVDTVPLPFRDYTETFSGIEGGKSAFVPSFHYARPLGENTTFGFSVVSPFGLSTDWGIASPVRYEATFSELITANFSPELGTKLTENFAVGAGLDLQYARVKFNRMLGVPNVINTANAVFGGTASPYADDTLSYNKGSSFGVGYHVGIMGLFNEQHTRIGLNYQSKMRHTFNGYSKLSGPLASTGDLFPNPVLPYNERYANNLNSAPIQFPDVVTLSAYHDLNEQLALLGSLVYTGWSCFNSIQLNNVPAPGISAGGVVSSVVVNSVAQQNYNDAWRAAIGANYKFNQQWMLRVGGGYDQTPTNNMDRDVRLPDVDRWALSVGAHYQAKPNLGVDVGYTHLFAVNDASVHHTDPLTATSYYMVNATGKVSADLVGAQVVWAIDQPAPIATK